MSFKDDFNEAVKGWMNNRWDFDDEVDVVLKWEEIPGWGGGCDTCGHGADVTKIVIKYINQDGEEKIHRFETTFGEILDELLRD